MPSACEVDVCGTVGMYALALASVRRARCSIGTTTTATIPTRRSASIARICRSTSSTIPDGLPGDHRRNGRQAEHVRHVRRASESRPDDFRALLDRRAQRANSRLRRAKATSRRIRSKRSAEPASCKFPRMQDLLRYICENGFEHHVAANLSQVSDIVHEAASKYLGWEMYRHQATLADKGRGESWRL